MHLSILDAAGDAGTTASQDNDDVWLIEDCISRSGLSHRHFQSCLLSQMTWLRGDKSTLEPGAAFDDCNLDVGCQWRLP